MQNYRLKLLSSYNISSIPLRIVINRAVNLRNNYKLTKDIRDFG